MEVKNSETPSILHFIWVGGLLPQNYLKTLIKIAPVAKKSSFTLNLWVDDDNNFNKSLENFMVFHNRKHLFLDLAISAKSLGITLRNINELLQKMEKTDFYQSDNRLRNFKSIIRREAIGFKNLAAVSDLLRYEILRQEGGTYCDTDTVFHIEKNSKFAPVKLSHGIKISCITDKETGNDIIASAPQHPVLELTIKYALNAYKEIDKRGFNKESYLDHYLNTANISPYGLYALIVKINLGSILTNTLAAKQFEAISLMDIKRYDFPDANFIGRRPKLILTVHTSGPAIIREAIDTFNITDCHTEVTKNFQLDQISLTDSASSSTCTKLGNVKLSSKFDQTWMSKDKKYASFDDSAISSKPFFWKPAKKEPESMKQLPTTLSQPIFSN